MKEKENKNEIK